MTQTFQSKTLHKTLNKTLQNTISDIKEIKTVLLFVSSFYKFISCCRNIKENVFVIELLTINK